MIHCGNNAVVGAFVSATGWVSNATAAAATCDMKGHGYLLCGLMTATQSDTTCILTNFHVEDADTTDASNFATISGWVAGTDYTLATALRAASTINTYQIGIPWVGRKRYARLVSRMAATSQVAAAWYHRFRNDEMPNTDAECNCEKAFFG